MGMALLPYLDKSQLTYTDHDLLEGNYFAFRAMAHSPATCRQFRDMVYHLKRTSLNPRLRELVLLQAGWQSQCRYEWFHHVKTGLEFGVSEEDIRVIMEDSDQANERLDIQAQLVLKITRQMYIGPASAEVLTELKKYLEPEKLVDLIVAIGFYIGGVRILATLDLDLEPQYEVYIERFPLRAKTTHHS